MKLEDLARELDAEYRGPADLAINGVAGIEEARPGQLTFIANQKYAGFARTTKASAILISPDFPDLATATLRTRNPYYAFAQAVGIFYQGPVYAPGIHPTAVVAPGAAIGNDAHIGAYVVVAAGVVLGDRAVLLPHVVLYPGAQIGDDFFAHAHAVVREGCRLGNRVVLQNGAVIGGDGFGFAKGNDGAWKKIPQSGPVIIADDVEVQSNACIDRASVGETRIGSGSKIDNLVQIGHGSSVGDHTLLCAQVGLAGSSDVGNNVILAGQVGVAGHCRIGDGVVATAQSGIPNDVPAGRTVSGYPAIDNRQWLRAAAAFRRLPDVLRQLRLRSSEQKDMQNRGIVE
jgi:UDP-3-O-[3-hydroxymyristoyl] glucosamine N-acyltransferase